jgi:hypothetical protein
MHIMQHEAKARDFQPGDRVVVVVGCCTYACRAEVVKVTRTRVHVREGSYAAPFLYDRATGRRADLKGEVAGGGYVGIIPLAEARAIEQAYQAGQRIRVGAHYLGFGGIGDGPGEAGGP